MVDATKILEAIQSGDPQASEQLIPLVYDELRRLAGIYMKRERPGQTLQATALVHEAYLRLAGSSRQEWDNHRHFLSAAAEAMRRILIENARSKKSLKHGGHFERVEMDAIELPTIMPSDDLLALNDALESLERADPQAAKLVKLRFFVGLTQAQTAEILGISRRTADSMWSLAKAWLYRALEPKETAVPQKTPPSVAQSNQE